MVLLTSALLPRCLLLLGHPSTRTSFRCTRNWIIDTAWTASIQEPEQNTKEGDSGRMYMLTPTYACASNPRASRPSIALYSVEANLVCAEHVHLMPHGKWLLYFCGRKASESKFVFRKSTACFVHGRSSSNLGFSVDCAIIKSYSHLNQKTMWASGPLFATQLSWAQENH